MLEFEPNAIAMMTASLEQCCRKLKNDTPEARKFVANQLKECARRGRVSLAALNNAGETAVAELNATDEAGGWRALFQWAN
jgi:urease gamma subunit